MSHWLNDDQLQVQDLVRRVARERVAPRAQDIDRKAEYPQDMFDMLKELGLFTLPFPTVYGGTNSLLSACVAVEELGRVCYNTAYLLVLQWVPIGAILAGGSREQKDKYLPGLSNGTLRGAFSLTEPQSGSDVAGIKTRAKRDGKGYRLNGSKMVGEALAAVESLAQENVSVEVIDLRTISPWDRETVMSSVEKTGRAVVVHEAVRAFGISAEIASEIAEEHFGILKVPVRRLGASFSLVPFSKPLETAYAPSRTEIASTIRGFFN